jgi:hypothetical protein
MHGHMNVKSRDALKFWSRQCSLVTDGQNCTCNIILGQKKPTMIPGSSSYQRPVAYIWQRQTPPNGGPRGSGGPPRYIEYWDLHFIFYHYVLRLSRQTFFQIFWFPEALVMNIPTFWNITPCINCIYIYRRFGEDLCPIIREFHEANSFTKSEAIYQRLICLHVLSPLTQQD